MVIGLYKNIWYQIEDNSFGCHYSIYEYTPITKQKHVIANGSDCQKNSFSEKYVRGLIDELIADVELNKQKNKKH